MSFLLSTSRSTGTVLPFLSINGYVALTGCTPKVLTAVAIAAHKTADVIIFFIFSPITKIYNILHTYNDIFSYLYQNQATVSVALATS